MRKESTQVEQRIGKSFLLSLFLSRFTVQLPSSIISLLLIEIGLTFGLEVGIIGQISAVNARARQWYRRGPHPADGNVDNSRTPSTRETHKRRRMDHNELAHIVYFHQPCHQFSELR
jgi:hypothetical protein